MNPLAFQRLTEAPSLIGKMPPLPEYVDSFGEKDGDNVWASFRWGLHRDHTQTVTDYYSGVSPIAQCTAGPYTHMTFPSRYGLYVKAGVDRPAPHGLWMGFWDPDLKEVCGLTKSQYARLPLLGKATADAKVQAVKWAPKMFARAFEDFWGVPPDTRG
jgi:hypothetical protein